MKILCKRTIVSLLICSVLSLNISGSDPIAYMNTLGYLPAQIETAESNNGMVSTQHFLATRVGEKILNKGGNAYDASIAIAFTFCLLYTSPSPRDS